MATPDEVRKLAALARIEVSDAEIESFAKEFDDILAYVGKIEELSVSRDPNARPIVRNVMRADEGAHESGHYTNAIAEQFPDREGDSLKVKQIISHD